MKTRNALLRLGILLILTTSLNVPAIAGPLDSLQLLGIIFNNNSQARDVVVNIYDHNKIFKQIHVKSSNRFVTYIPINSIMTIEITAPDFHTKRFIMDTTVPNKIKKSQLKYNFDIDIFREEELKHINTSFLDFPVGLVSFHNKKAEFIRNKKYTKRMKKAYLKLWAESQETEAKRQGEGLK